MRCLKSEKGITLVALIITIIILIILAAVTIISVNNMQLVPLAVNGTQNYAIAQENEGNLVNGITDLVLEAIDNIENGRTGNDKDVIKTIDSDKFVLLGNGDNILIALSPSLLNEINVPFEKFLSNLIGYNSLDEIRSEIKIEDDGKPSDAKSEYLNRIMELYDQTANLDLDADIINAVLVLGSIEDRPEGLPNSKIKLLSPDGSDYFAVNRTENKLLYHPEKPGKYTFTLILENGQKYKLNIQVKQKAVIWRISEAYAYDFSSNQILDIISGKIKAYGETEELDIKDEYITQDESGYNHVNIGQIFKDLQSEKSEDEIKKYMENICELKLICEDGSEVTGYVWNL